MRICKEIPAYAVIKYIASELKPYEIITKREFIKLLENLGYNRNQIDKNLDSALGKNGNKENPILMDEEKVFSTLPGFIDKPTLPWKVEAKLEKILLELKKGRWN